MKKFLEVTFAFIDTILFYVSHFCTLHYCNYSFSNVRKEKSANQEHVHSIVRAFLGSMYNQFQNILYEEQTPPMNGRFTIKRIGRKGIDWKQGDTKRVLFARPAFL